MDTCQIIITRAPSAIGCALKHTVELDGIAVGVLKNGGTLTTYATLGPHTITFLDRRKIRGSISVLIEPGDPILGLFIELYGNQNVRIVKEGAAGQGKFSFAPGPTMKCRTCGTDITKGANRCPICGAMARSRSKMTTCKSCGHEIAKTANICPHCGTKRRQGTRAACWILAILLISFWACYTIFSPSDSSPSKQAASSQGDGVTVSAGSPTPTPVTAVSVSAKDLWKAYTDNKVSADDLYKDKIIAVTGTITNIGQDLVTKAPCVSLDTGDSLGIYAVQCFFPKKGEQHDLIAALSDGDTITIYGTCEGTPIMQVQLSGCYLEG